MVFTDWLSITPAVAAAECPNRRMFSLKTGTVMAKSPLGYRKWAMAVYLFSTNLKGVPSVKLHRDLKISQKSAWFMAHRLRESWKLYGSRFSGPVPKLSSG